MLQQHCHTQNTLAHTGCPHGGAARSRLLPRRSANNNLTSLCLTSRTCSIRPPEPQSTEYNFTSCRPKQHQQAHPEKLQQTLSDTGHPCKVVHRRLLVPESRIQAAATSVHSCPEAPTPDSCPSRLSVAPAPTRNPAKQHKHAGINRQVPAGTQTAPLARPRTAAAQDKHHPADTQWFICCAGCTVKLSTCGLTLSTPAVWAQASPSTLPPCCHEH